MACSLFILDSGIYQAVDQIHRQIDENEHGGNHQDGALYYRVVGCVDGVDEVGAQTVDDKYLLGDDGAAQQTAEAGAELGEQRDHGIAQGVDEHHFLLGNALGLGSADIVRLEHIQHGGPPDAHEAGNGGRG